MLSPEYISGIDKIDELTELIHKKETPLKYKKYLSQLRDEYISNYHDKSSYYHNYYEYQYKLGKYFAPPTINWEIKIFQLGEGYTLELGSFKHISLPEKIGYFIYIKDENKNIILTKIDEYYKNHFLDENNQLINKDEYRYIVNDIPMNETIYGLYHISSLYKTTSSPQSIFEYIIDNWDEKSYTYSTISNGKQCILNLFSNIKSQLEKIILK